jgi:hypothetical protein
MGPVMTPMWSMRNLKKSPMMMATKKPLNGYS